MPCCRFTCICSIADSIETNVENAVSHVESANVQLTQANQYQVRRIITFFAVITIWSFYMETHALSSFMSVCYIMLSLHRLGIAQTRALWNRRSYL